MVQNDSNGPKPPKEAELNQQTTWILGCMRQKLDAMRGKPELEQASQIGDTIWLLARLREFLEEMRNTPLQIPCRAEMVNSLGSWAFVLNEKLKRLQTPDEAHAELIRNASLIFGRMRQKLDRMVGTQELEETEQIRNTIWLLARLRVFLEDLWDRPMEKPYRAEMLSSLDRWAEALNQRLGETERRRRLQARSPD